MDFLDTPESDIVATLQTHGKILKEQSTSLSKIEIAVIGDPYDEQKPGLVGRVKNCEAFIAGCVARKKEERGRQKHWGRWVLESLITVAVVILVWKVFKVQL